EPAHHGRAERGPRARRPRRHPGPPRGPALFWPVAPDRGAERRSRARHRRARRHHRRHGPRRVVRLGRRAAREPRAPRAVPQHLKAGVDVATTAAPGALPVVDLVLRGGRISTFADPEQGPAEVSAIALAGGRVVAIGGDDDVATYVPLAARVIELEGRRVLPGLNDSHIHAVRGGVSWTRTVHWEDVRSLSEGLERLRADAATRAPGEWVAVVGGWHSSQLAEGRAPTDRKSTRLNSSHVKSSYAVWCLKKKRRSARDA